MTRAAAWLVTCAVAVIAIGLVVIPHPLEGPVILTFSKDHGLHVSDLVVGAVAAALLTALWRIHRRQRSCRGTAT